MSMEMIIGIVLVVGAVLSVWLVIEVIFMIQRDMDKDDYIFELENRLAEEQENDEDF